MARYTSYNANIIVGIGLSLIAGLATCGLGIYYIIRRNKRQNERRVGISPVAKSSSLYSSGHHSNIMSSGTLMSGATEVRTAPISDPALEEQYGAFPARVLLNPNVPSLSDLIYGTGESHHWEKLTRIIWRIFDAYIAIWMITTYFWNISPVYALITQNAVRNSHTSFSGYKSPTFIAQTATLNVQSEKISTDMRAEEYCVITLSIVIGIFITNVFAIPYNMRSVKSYITFLSLLYFIESLALLDLTFPSESKTALHAILYIFAASGLFRELLRETPRYREQERGDESSLRQYPFQLLRKTGNTLTHLSNKVLEIARKVYDLGKEISAQLGIAEKPLALGEVRIRWICACGHRAYDDYFKPGEEERHGIVRRIMSYGHVTEVTVDQNTSKNFQSWIGNLSDRIKNSLRDLGVENKPKITDDSFHGSIQTPTARKKQKKQSNSKPKYLLLCIRDKVSSLELHHFDVGEITSDKELFEKFAEKYKSVSFARLFRFRRLVDMRFVEFDVWRNQSVNRIIRYDELPPRKQWSKYEFNPRVWSLPPPPISGSRLMHLLKCPEKSAYISNCLSQFPKKLGTRLDWSDDPIERVGWGIEFIEDFHWGTGLTAFVIILFFVGFLFGVLYGYFKHDFRTAFSISSYAALFISVITASWQARVMAEMRVAW